jgi:spermidine synthase
MILFFLSGFCGLIYQIIWIRILTLIFGITTFAVSTVVAAFMAGLSLGSFYFGRLVDKIRNPLKLFAILELGIGLFALLSPLIFSGIDQLYILIYKTFTLKSFISSIIRFILAFCVILIPTSLMGGTLPVLIKFFVKDRRISGRISGYLYSINTLGAVVGTFLTGFFLIKLFGVKITLISAGILNLFIGAFSLILWQLNMKFFHVEHTQEETEIITNTNKIIKNKRTYQILLWGFAFSGFTSLAYEILWTRSLLYFLGLTTYTFSTILTTFLIGITAGSYIISKVVDKRRDLLTWFGSIEILLGFSALLVIPVLENFYSISNTLRNWIGYNTYWGNVGVKFVLSFILMLVPTLLMGAAFPVVVKCYTRNIEGIGKNVGEIYSANTIGAIIGSLLAGFLLIPLFGIRMSISLIVLINISIGLIVFLLHPDLRKSRQLFVSALCVFIIVVIVMNVNQLPVIFSSVEFKGPSKRYDLLYYKEGVDASIAVLKDRITGERELNINGESTAFTIYQDIQVHKLLGHLPLFMHPDPKNVLIVGFGFGSTSWATMLYPAINTDCVELVRDEIKTADYFINENHHVLNNPRFNLIIDDGRNYIKGTNKRYDMISFNAIHPKISPNLYTLDFYKMCKRILKKDGIIIAWLPPNAITETEYQSLINTFQTVFQHSSLWYVNPSHTLLLATPESFQIDYKLMLKRINIKDVHSDLREVNLEDPLEILSCFIMAEDNLKDYCRNAPLNSDDLPYIEFSRELSVSVNTEVMNNLQKLKMSVWPYLSNFEKDSLIILKELDLYIKTKSLVAQGQILAWIGQYDAARSYYLNALKINPDNRNTVYLNNLISRRKEELYKLTQLNPQNAKAFQALGEIYLEEKNISEAMNSYSKAISLDPQYANAYHHLGVCYYMQKKLNKALRFFSKAVQLDSTYGASYFYTGMCAWQMGDLNRSIRNLQKSIRFDPGFAQSHYYLAMAYERKGWTYKARQQLEEAFKIDPGLFHVRENLND